MKHFFLSILMVSAVFFAGCAVKSVLRKDIRSLAPQDVQSQLLSGDLTLRDLGSLERVFESDFGHKVLTYKREFVGTTIFTTLKVNSQEEQLEVSQYRIKTQIRY